MPRPIRLCFALLTFLLLLQLAVSADPPATPSSPSPSPEYSDDFPSPSPITGSPYHSPSPAVDSPPDPPPSDLAPGSSPTPSPLPPSASPPTPTTTPSSSPSPAPSDASDVNHGNVNFTTEEDTKESSGGLSSGKKAGIAVAVLVAFGVIVVGGFVYKKRQDNIRRSQFGHAARREIL